MKVLLIGSGGREHALAAALNRDTTLEELHVAPGNPGIAEIALCHEINTDDNNAVVALAEKLGIDLVVVGPEKPLVNGLADALSKAKIACFGPSKAAAQLEGSKDFAKQVMRDAGVPTAKSFTCTNRAEIEKALDTFGAPYVVKHDGLAAGKGVVVTNDRDEAIEHALQSTQVVIEEFLDGPEVSLFGISDGKTVIAMQPAQDFKRAFDGDLGPNTGGMGAYSPLPWAPDEIMAEVLTQVLNPTVKEMAARGTPFVGLLYAGLALTARGTRVIEFNARFGDPETQVLLPRLKTPLAQLLFAAATSKLENFQELEWSDQSAVTVVLASEGYPSQLKSGEIITGIQTNSNSSVFHAGTQLRDGVLRSSGGRVLSVTGLGSDLTQARDAAYRTISRISLPGSHYRRDIALNASVAEKGN
ncbi:MAG: phosphoribosylamine--glycine ligase [SAR202 cluster bacterium]|nr:phosphoribosylamine--glycine ligase [SAR202 cluster bacterium]